MFIFILFCFGHFFHNCTAESGIISGDKVISEHVRKFALDIRVTKYVRITPAERFLFLLQKVS